MVLVAKKNGTLVEKVNEALTKPLALTDGQWEAPQYAILLRRKQIEERLLERDAYVERDSAESLVCALLREA
jgi:hypothetical protein